MIFDLLFQIFVYCEKHAYKNQNENSIPDYKHSLKEFRGIDTLAISGDRLNGHKRQIFDKPI